MPTALDLENEIRTLSKKAYEITQDTSMTPAEMKAALDKIEPEIETKCTEHAEVKHLEDARKKYGALSLGEAPVETNAHDAGGSSRPVVKSLGEQFVESEGYKALVAKGIGNGGTFTTGEVELKTLLSEGDAGTPGPGYTLVSQPQLLPGVVDIRFAPLRLVDLFAQGTTDSPLLRYLVETVVTNAAAATGEGQLMPESAIEFGDAHETLTKVTTFLPVTDEMLSDYQQSRSYIDARLGLFVRLDEETEVVSGDGTGDHMVGLLNRTGLATSIVQGTSPSVSGDNAMDAIYRQITAIRWNAFMEPDSVCVDPLGDQTIMLTKSAQGVYYAGGPFLNAAGGMIWGKKLVSSATLAANSSLVGAFQSAAQIFRKGGIVVEASNAHADFFQRGKTAIRAQERLMLAVYRPGAFGTVTNLH